MRQPRPELADIVAKSGKSNCRKNLAKVDIEASPLLHRLSVPLRGSEIDLGSVDMVPHVVARKAHQRF